MNSRFRFAADTIGNFIKLAMRLRGGKTLKINALETAKIQLISHRSGRDVCPPHENTRPWLVRLMMQAGIFVPFTHYKREEDTTMESGKLDGKLSRMNEIVEKI